MRLLAPVAHAQADTPVVHHAAAAVAHAQAVRVPFLAQALLPVAAVAAVAQVAVVPAVQPDVARQSARVVVVATAKNFSQ